ncbi:MAG TPA: tetratricopeptide repeat protein, partial [Candidatus Binatia bacterium]|nr:tetratricopeptide repeat protein [Candidatus Binatia bacterium]
GPFNLLTYAEVQKRASQIAEVTQKRYMPPWLPEPGHGDFVNSRRLTQAQIDLIQRWVAQGAAEGNAAELPPQPKWVEGWQLGKPDLVVQMPQAYTLPAKGKDVYRNFVIPIPVASQKYVAAVEFNPGNPQVVHHAFINVDTTRQSRRQAERENPPGFDGMVLPQSAHMPGGQLLGWQPGKQPYRGSKGLAWVLEKETDLVLQLHMQPSGKPEPVQPNVAFYFTGQAPTNTAFRINLSRLEIDVPAGATNHVVEQSYVLPIDVELLRISAHTHYLGKELTGFALLPDGARKPLLLIKDWDFNWQGDYEYAKPVFLPKGTKLGMRYTFDNSTNNVQNPNNPPKRVTYGLNTTDEMAELWFQVLPRNPSEREALAKDFYAYLSRVLVEYYNYSLARDPNDASAHTKLGRSLLYQGRIPEALQHLQAAVRINPEEDKAHYELGYIYLRQGKLVEAQQEFETVIRIRPDDYQAHGSLGSIYLRQRDLQRAEESFARAVQLNPDDAIAAKNLERVREVKRR